MEYCGSAVMCLRDFYEAITPLDAPHQAFPIRSNAISAPTCQRNPPSGHPDGTPARRFWFTPHPPAPLPPPSAFHASVRVFRIPLGRELSGFSRLPAHAAGCGGRVQRGHGVGWGEGGGQARRRRQLNAPVASSRAPTPGAGTITSRAVTASGLSEAAVEFTNPTKKSAPVWKMPLAAIV